MLLTTEEIKDLTGYSRPSAQIRWLREHAYPFEISGKGQPKVLRSVVEQKLGGKLSSEPRLRLAV